MLVTVVYLFIAQVDYLWALAPATADLERCVIVKSISHPDFEC